MRSQADMPQACPLCGYAGTCALLERHTDDAVEYTLHACPSCGVAFWWPLQNPGGAWYEHDERYAGANKNPPREPNINHRLTIALLSGKEGRVLDVGCGTGNFLSHAAERGWDVYGIDFDANAVRAATDVFKLPHIEQASLEEFVQRHPDLLGTFDLVTFFDVFEHIDAHAAFASLVRSLVKPSGHIAMSMPYRYGARWLQPNDLPPRHLTRWDERSLSEFWKRAGFSPMTIKRIAASFSAILMKFRFRYGKKFSFGVVGKSAAKETPQANSSGPARHYSLRYRILLALARAKDLILFGIPAAICWVRLLGRKERYTGLYALFSMDHHA